MHVGCNDNIVVTVSASQILTVSEKISHLHFMTDGRTDIQADRPNF